uniref:LIM zinc-binding domain-containing protein n=1 Tax=Hucho hucho TaxID=62062 RepID=A0A4W5NKH9_9TELE
MDTNLKPLIMTMGGRGAMTIHCLRCREVCKGEVVRVQNVHFHVKCFTCQVCGCDLARSGFFQKGGEYICTEDYQRLYGTKCDSCGDFITGEVVSALGRTYHPKCFVCSMLNDLLYWEAGRHLISVELN